MLDEGQYALDAIEQYELIYGKDFVSPGGSVMAEKLIGSMALHKGARVLDIGCGLGGSAFMMAQQFGLRVDAIDLSQNMMSQAISRCHEYQLEDAISLSLMDCLDITAAGKYDAVYSRDVFLHIANKQKLFSVIAHALKPGGLLLFTDYCCGPRPWSEKFDTYVAGRGYHLCGIEEYAQLVTDAGMHVHRADDLSDQFSDLLQCEKQAIAGLNLAQSMRDQLIESREEKISHVSSGEHRWGLIQANLVIDETAEYRNKDCLHTVF